MCIYVLSNYTWNGLLLQFEAHLQQSDLAQTQLPPIRTTWEVPHSGSQSTLGRQYPQATSHPAT
jgi:hypothetical protein